MYVCNQNKYVCTAVQISHSGITLWNFKHNVLIPIKSLFVGPHASSVAVEKLFKLFKMFGKYRPKLRDQTHQNISLFDFKSLTHYVPSQICAFECLDTSPLTDNAICLLQIKERNIDSMNLL